MHKPLVILDRDGVINRDSDKYIKSADEWLPVEGSLEAIAMLNRHGYLVGVATNQSGLARGLFDENELDAMHAKMSALLAEHHGHIDALEYCPHHPNEDCACRKPKPGMLKTIAKTLSSDLTKAYYVGDSYKDIEAALSVSAAPILVMTGKGKRTLEAHPELTGQVSIYDNLLKFVTTLVREHL